MAHKHNGKRIEKITWLGEQLSSRHKPIQKDAAGLFFRGSEEYNEKSLPPELKAMCRRE